MSICAVSILSVLTETPGMTAPMQANILPPTFQASCPPPQGSDTLAPGNVWQTAFTISRLITTSAEPVGSYLAVAFPQLAQRHRDSRRRPSTAAPIGGSARYGMPGTDNLPILYSNRLAGEFRGLCAST